VPEDLIYLMFGEEWRENTIVCCYYRGIVSTMEFVAYLIEEYKEIFHMA